MTVIKMPDRLERRAQKIEAAMTRRTKGNEEWIEGTIELAVELAGARSDCGDDDTRFGKWLIENAFGANVIGPNERSILIEWAKDPEGTRIMLARTESRSIQYIDRTLHRSMKGPPDTVKREEAKEAIRVHKATYGVYPSVIEACRDTGLSRIVIEPALAAVKAEDRVAPSEIRFTKAQEHHVEMRVKMEVKVAIEQLHKSFETEVEKRNKADIDRLFPDLEKMREDARRTEKLYRGLLERASILTKSVYHDLLFLALNKEVGDERKKRSAQFLIENKLKLIGEN